MEKKETDFQTEGIRSAEDLSPRVSEGKGISREHYERRKARPAQAGSAGQVKAFGL